MKKILTSALVLALTFGAAQAQTTSPEKQKQRKENRMGGMEGLNLTEDQKAQMKAIHQDFKTQSQELRKQDQITVAEMKAKRKALHEQHQAKIQSVLTAEQKEVLAKKKAEWKEKGKAEKNFKGRKGAMKGKAGEVRMQKGGGEFGKELGLTADQQTKITEIRTSFRSQLQSLRNDNTLSQEQKREKMQSLMKQQQEQMKAVLTKEQVEKMESLRKTKPARARVTK